MPKNGQAGTWDPKQDLFYKFYGEVKIDTLANRSQMVSGGFNSVALSTTALAAYYDVYLVESTVSHSPQYEYNSWVLSRVCVIIGSQYIGQPACSASGIVL